MPLRLLLTVLLTCSLTSFVHAAMEDLDWHTDLDAAQAEARATDRDLLLNFTGGSWCPNCQLLKETVLSTPEFAAWVEDRFVLVYLDYTQTAEPVSEEFAAQHAAIREKYGYVAFPRVVFADAQLQPYASTGYISQLNLQQYLQHFDQLHAIGDRVETLREQAAAADGAERAATLDTMLDTVGVELAVKHYPQVIDQIVSLDAGNAGGYKQKYQQLRIASMMQDASLAIRVGDLQTGYTLVQTLLDDYEVSASDRQKLLATRGQILIQAGQVRAGVESLREAVAADPDSDLAGRVKQLVDQLQPAAPVEAGDPE